MNAIAANQTPGQTLGQTLGHTLGQTLGPISRAGLLAGVAGLLLAGCTMCPDIHDYSGPVPNGSSPQNDFRARSTGVAPIGNSPRTWPPLVNNERPDLDQPILVAGEEPASHLTR